MNKLQMYANKLRKVANAIDELFVDTDKENVKTAFEITSGVRKFKRSTRRKHWTQTVAGKRKMSKVQKAVWARKKTAEKKAS